MNKFIEYLKEINSSMFEKGDEKEIQQLEELGKKKLPKEFIMVYQEAMPIDNVEIYNDIVLYSFNRIKEENLDAVPGANIYPYGLLTFASTLDGDAICIDLNDKSSPIYQCSHSLLSDEEEISFYKNKMISKEFSYDNIIKFSIRLANNYREFVEEIMMASLEIYDVVGNVIENYKE
ncbi:MAG: hypothetical protein Q8936_22810 [Bacillota bacterium]|nr:hypothetical protein [Bacillota bacterium]